VEPCHSSVNTCGTSSQRLPELIEEPLTQMRELLRYTRYVLAGVLTRRVHNRIELTMLRLHIVYVRYLLGTLSAVAFKIGAN
jgi:hypothetical protein